MAVIKQWDEMKPFYRNIYIARPVVLQSLLTFMGRAIAIAETNEQVRSLLQKDSSYKEGKKEVAIAVFGTPYYQLYPFIFERLPAFFLHAEGYRICHDKSGPCQYNT